MRMRITLHTLALLAVGSLLGYAAAIIDFPGKADASVATDKPLALIKLRQKRE